MFVRGLHEALPKHKGNARTRNPAFDTTSAVVVVSDYSAREGPWRLASFLFIPEESVPSLMSRLSSVRATASIKDDRRFEFKSLRDLLRWRALPQWLNAFDDAPGLAFTLLVSASVTSAIHSNDAKELDALVACIRDELGLGDWSTTSSGGPLLEEAIRIMHCVAYTYSYLTAGRAVPLTWLSDNDQVFDGALRRRTFDGLFPQVLEKYAGASVPLKHPLI